MKQTQHKKRKQELRILKDGNTLAWKVKYENVQTPQMSFISVNRPIPMAEIHTGYGEDPV